MENLEIKKERDRDATEQLLLNAVGIIIEKSGFEALGINAVAAQAGVSKMLIYRYFESLDGLIAAYIHKNDFWINFDMELPEPGKLGEFCKQLFKEQIRLLRENYALKRLYRWELTSDNTMVKELRDRREAKGVALVTAISRISGRPQKEVASLSAFITAGISYLVLLEENCPMYSGIPIQLDSGWAQIEAGIEQFVDMWIKNK